MLREIKIGLTNLDYKCKYDLYFLHDHHTSLPLLGQTRAYAIKVNQTLASELMANPEQGIFIVSFERYHSETTDVSTFPVLIQMKCPVEVD